MTPELLISQSRVAALVSDPRQHDNPIIACNDAFAQLTGYAREEILQRNCRFLRGEGTEPDKTALLRKAIAERQPVIVELINYRKNGSTFRNAVMIAPVFDDRGTLIYYLGSQMEVDNDATQQRASARAAVESLSLRQREILEKLSGGRMNKQIAFELGLTERTVKMHRAALMRALEVRTLAEAIRIGIEAGL